MSLLAQYLFSEASSGTTPSTIGDNVSPALNATITYGSGAGWTSIAAGNGLRSSTNQTRARSATFNTSGKLYTGLHGGTAVTLELVVRFTAFPSGQIQNIMEIGDAVLRINAFEGALAARTFTTAGNSDVNVNSASVSLNTVYVLHATWNGSTSKIFLNGTDVSFGGSSVGGTINLSNASDRLVAFMCRADGGGVASGVEIFYAAVYNDVALLDSGARSARVTALLAANDTDPNAAGGDIEVSTGLATETDSAQAPTRQKQRTAGVSVDTSTAVARQVTKQRAPGVATETDAAQSRTLSKRASVALAASTDSAQARSVSRSIVAGVAAGTETASALDTDKRATAGIASEIDGALALSIDVSVAVGVATELDVAVTRDFDKLASVGRADESEVAIGRTVARQIGTGTAVEANAALSRSFALSYGVAVEVDAAAGLTFGFSVDAANETDAAQTITLARRIAVGQAIDAAASVGVFAFVKRRSPGVAAETDTAASLFSGAPTEPPGTGTWVTDAADGTGAWATEATSGTNEWAAAPAPGTGEWIKITDSELMAA